MEKSEPTFVPEWLKSSGSLNTSHQFTSSSLYSDEQGVSKSVRNKSLANRSDNDLGRPSVSDRATSSYFRRTSSSNGTSHLMSYSSFGRSHRDKDWDKDTYDFRNKEKSDNRHRDYSDPLGNILPSRFEKDGLRRAHSNVSGKPGETWPKKVAGDLNNTNKSSQNSGSLLSGGSSVSGVKTVFERDFPSLGADEKQADPDMGIVPSPGLSTALQSLPIGNSAVIGGDGWTSALAEVPVIVGSNGSSASIPQPVQPTSISAAASLTSGRNMAETLTHGPPRAQTAPQLSVGTQRLEELAVKQSRQLIPMTPSMPKALALNSCDKPKPKVGQLQLHLVNHTHSTRPVSVKPDASKTSTVGKLLVLKPSRERNGIIAPAKESLSPTGCTKLPNSPVAVVERKRSVATLEKRPSPQAQSRSNFFNLMRKKSIMTNNSSSVAPDDKSGEAEAPPIPQAVNVSGGDNKTCNGGKNHSGSEALLYSEEEEARFLRSLGWDETAEEEEEEGLTEEEISSFYRDVSKYLNLKPASKFLKGAQPKLHLHDSKMASP